MGARVGSECGYNIPGRDSMSVGRQERGSSSFVHEEKNRSSYLARMPGSGCQELRNKSRKIS